MKQPTAVQRAKTLWHIQNALDLLNRRIPSEEQRQAAQALGLEHYLPDPQTVLDFGP